MRIRAIIIDDEPLAQNVILEYAKKLENLTIMESFSEATPVHSYLLNHETDLLFLDINMPKLSGISFLKSLKNPPLVIFTTAYSEYAVEGFELNAVDYLRKPFSFERFCQAIFKVEEKLLSLPYIKSANTISPDFMFIKSNKKNIKISFDQILYIEGLGDYIKIYTQDSKHITNLSMKRMLDLLPSEKFYRIHKSYIIALDKINSVEGNLVQINTSKLPVGNSYRSDFFAYLRSFSAD